MTLLDANYVLRWFLDDVESHSAVADKLLKEIKPESLSIDRISIAEVTYVLRSKGYNHMQIALLFDELFAFPSLAEMSTVTSLSLDIFKDTTLDFEDCWLASYAMTNNVEVATFDKKLQKLIQK